MSDTIEAASHVVRATVPHLPSPPAALMEEALVVPVTRLEHDHLAQDLPAFNAVEVRQPTASSHIESRLRVAAWNAERLKYHVPSVKLVAGVAPDVLLLTETDVGMARSGNRHTTADLAGELGMGYAYGVEFLELGLGDEREREWHRRETNKVGFHGNAILSRLPMVDPVLIRLDDGAVWWLDAKDGQRRLGWRMAIAARLELEEGAVLVVSAHLESKSDAADRAAQVERLIGIVDELSGGIPVVIGGDLNTNALPADGGQAWIDAPQLAEPLFRLMADAGYQWQASNTADPTLRMRPDGTPLPPYRRIDWLFTRGLVPNNPITVAALDAEGVAISDHELIAVDVSLR